MQGKSNNNAMNSVPQNGGKINSFETLKRNFETAIASGQDTAAPLMDLSTAIAYSVIGKCIDPQRKTAPQREGVSTNGYNPMMVELKQGIAADTKTLDNLRRISNEMTRTAYNADGETITITDKDAETALASLISETLSDGIDLVQTAALAILEQAKDHATSGEKWLDRPYTVRRLNKKVWIKTPDSAAYTETETSPIQEIYKAVRRQIMSSRAVQTDPRNGYTYVEDYTADGLDTIYLRMGKYADIGGYDCNGNYTAGTHTVKTYESILEKLNLTARQATILQLRMQGNGYKAIATYLGVTPSAITKTVKQIAAKCVDIGFMPDGYEPQPKEQKPAAKHTNKPTTVIQIDQSGKAVAQYESINAASRETGIDRKGIYNTITGKARTAGGYYWKVESITE